MGGTTCYLQVKAISPSAPSADGRIRSRSPARWPSTPPPTSPRGALLVHIAPERAWTLSLARRAAGGAPTRTSTASRSPARSGSAALNHLAHAALSGRPVLLIGAGSGVRRASRCCECSRASRCPPARASASSSSRARSRCSRPSTASCCQAVLTASPASNGFLPSSTSPERCRRDQRASSTRPPPARHSFRGAFRLRALPSGALAAHAAPSASSRRRVRFRRRPATCGARSSWTRSAAARRDGRLPCVTWPLCAPSEEAAPWADKPTVVSGWPLLLAWLALAGAHSRLRSRTPPRASRGADRRRCPPSARRHFWTATAQGGRPPP